jgi:hypothetical protein
LEKRVSDLVLESQERNDAAERYKGEVTRVETFVGVFPPGGHTNE